MSAVLDIALEGFKGFEMIVHRHFRVDQFTE